MMFARFACTVYIHWTSTIVHSQPEAYTTTSEYKVHVHVQVHVQYVCIVYMHVHVRTCTCIIIHKKRVSQEVLGSNPSWVMIIFRTSSMTQYDVDKLLQSL